MTDTQDLRQTARTLFDAAVAAADPARAMARALGHTPLPTPKGRSIVIAVGKAAPAMMTATLPHVPGPVEALVVTHHENPEDAPGARVMRAGHPVPDAAGLQAATAVMDLLDSAGPDDAVIALISGGGSALLPAPVPGLTLADKAEVNRVLLGGGLDITAMNLVRQNLSQLKGGGFLRRAAPAPVTAYLLSDVIGDDLRVIASGPTVGPVGSATEARALLQDRRLWDALPAAARTVLDRTGANAPLPSATNTLIGSNRHSLEAMQAVAPDRAEIINDRLEGDVAEAAAVVLAQFKTPKTPRILLFGGETTVRLTGNGRGGRNQELALRVAMGAPAVGFDWLFLSGGTDGRDGPTDAAGGIVDAGTVARIAQAGGDARALLANNDSYAALRLAGDLLITAATGTNVADVQALLLRPREASREA
ncbi:DUF4147 domain-containing protein [Mesobacterium sp. TK19101]|uniref:DUF4147 domain-containing protein n=1 Tax=Mesobacterium hydrothermale TaxID=3111907 RepID=A0ABU6HN13_9RHOB|nr:DUF4147 domain-containing protein [Mesobacterium sp. TK19101]MEC3863230.1 DUF4147 domain-containing protein [Mesobacterium sp. TK19101]